MVAILQCLVTLIVREGFDKLQSMLLETEDGILQNTVEFALYSGLVILSKLSQIDTRPSQA